MESLVVTANSKSELEILQAVARKLGLTTFELSDGVRFALNDKD